MMSAGNNSEDSRMSRVLLCIALFLAAPACAQEAPFVRTEDVVYGRKHGVALTLDVFQPKENANGAAVLWVISGGWFSAKQGIRPEPATVFVKRGYTVFAVVHGSQPRFTIPEAIEDMQRSVRFIRANAAKYKIDPERIGITGGSAGGHLSLMIGLGGAAANPKAADPVDRESSRVGAVACFYPPTDFLNWGKEGEVALGTGPLAWLPAPFEFVNFDKDKKKFVPVDEAGKLEIGKRISPITHVSGDDPPILLIHGDADKVVPIYQAEILMAKLKEAKVTHELTLRPGAGHGWKDIINDLTLFADWFDKHLPKK